MPESEAARYDEAEPLFQGWPSSVILRVPGSLPHPPPSPSLFFLPFGEYVHYLQVRSPSRDVVSVCLKEGATGSPGSALRPGLECDPPGVLRVAEPSR